MGSKDKAKRELRKPKKDGKKTGMPSLFEQPAEVEVIKKKGKKEDIPE